MGGEPKNIEPRVPDNCPLARELKRTVAIAGPFGIRIEFRGVQIIAVLVLCGMAAIGTATWTFAEASKDRDTQMIDRQTKVETAILEMTYVLTLSQEERQALQLDMPDSLRAKVNRIGGSVRRQSHPSQSVR